MIKENVISAILNLDIQKLVVCVKDQKSLMDLSTYQFLTELNKVFTKVKKHDCEVLECMEVLLDPISPGQTVTESFIEFISQQKNKTDDNDNKIEKLLSIFKNYDTTKIDEEFSKNGLVGKWKKNSNSFIESYAFYSTLFKIYFSLSFEIDNETKTLQNIWSSDNEIINNLYLSNFEQINFDKIVFDNYLSYRPMKFQIMVEEKINNCLNSIFTDETTIVSKDNFQDILDKLMSITDLTGMLPDMDYHDVSSVFKVYDKIIHKFLSLEVIFELIDLVSLVLEISETKDREKLKNLSWILLGDELFRRLNENYCKIFEIKPFDTESFYLINEKPHIVIDSQIIFPIEQLYKSFQAVKKQFLLSN